MKSLYILSFFFIFNFAFAGEKVCKKEVSKLQITLENSRSCKTDSECELLYFGCPFGCAVAVNNVSKKKIITLYKNYKNLPCEYCAYKCHEGTRYVACVEQVCREIP